MEQSCEREALFILFALVLWLIHLANGFSVNGPLLGPTLARRRIEEMRGSGTAATAELFAVWQARE